MSCECSCLLDILTRIESKLDHLAGQGSEASPRISLSAKDEFQRMLARRAHSDEIKQRRKSKSRQ